jgi:hypothetical protein
VDHRRRHRRSPYGVAAACASTTYFVRFSIAKTNAATQNDANAQADELVALVEHNLSRL